MRFFSLKCILLFTAFIATSCNQVAASPGAAQRIRGQDIYEQSCATSTCHGTRGEGILEGNEFRVWPLVGEEFQRRNPSAQVIFDVVRSGGEPSLRALTDQQIYDSIAYELSLNGVQNAERLTSKNARTIYSGNSEKTPNSGNLYPPPGETRFVDDWATPILPICGENTDLRLCVTQIALATSIAGYEPSNGGWYVMIISTMEVLTDHPIKVEPRHLRLVTKDELSLEALEIDLDFPVARLFSQVIRPAYSTSFLSIFALPETSELALLLYTLPGSQQLTVDLIP